MTRHRTRPMVLGFWIVVLAPLGAQPPPRCEQWNSEGFFQTASAELVSACIAAGASLEELSEPSGTWHDYRNAMTPLHAAVRAHATAAIEILLANGADPNGLDDRGFAPLHIAPSLWSPAIALLLEAGADVHIRAESGLGATPLHYAARHSASATHVELLVAAGADAEAKDDSGRTPLHYAAERNGNPLVFDALQEAGADVNARDNDGQTPLFDASSNSNSTAFEWLVAAGADARVRDNDGLTLLHTAARGVDPAAIEHLLGAGADVNTRSPRNKTPLHEAAMWSGWEDDPRGPPRERSTAVVEALLAAGADIEALYDDGWTALHLAARFNHNPAVVELLLAAGADVNARSESGDTPLDLARSRTPLTIREVLRAHPLPPRPAADEVEDVPVFRDCPMCPALLVVPAGRFRMGCVFESNACWSESNLPAREVDVASFALPKFEVTRGEFAAFVAATGYDVSGGCRYEPGSWRDQIWQRDDHPVICVNWDDTQAYVQWLSEETGYRYRLPTESEWEYAARAGTKTRFHWGYRAGELCKYANSGYCDDDGWERTAPVGSFLPNAFGLYDMAGNVDEWVEDCWHGNYEGAPRDGSAWKDGGDCGLRVARGGSWGPSLERHYRSADRDRHDVGFRFFRLGFRVARSLGEL